MICRLVWAEGDLPTPADGASDPAPAAHASTPSQTPRVTIQVQGDRLEYDQDSGTVAVTGQVRLTARTDAPGYPTLSMVADQVEGNLREGVIAANAGIKVLSQQFALKGERARLNFKTEEFVLEQGAAEVSLPNPGFPGQVMRGYIFGDRVAREGHLIFLIEGRVTTCDRARPHYSIHAGKVTYDTETQVMTVERGRVQLYGLGVDLPLPPLKTHLGGTAGPARLKLPMPGYVRHEGLYLPLMYRFTKPKDEWQAWVGARVGTEWRLPAEAVVTHLTDEEEFLARVARRDLRGWDFDRTSSVDWTPQVSYLRHLMPSPEGLPRLDLGVRGGYARETPLDDALPSREAGVVGLSASYSPRPRQRANQEDWWWALGLDQSFYSTGDTLLDVRLEAGVGANLGDWGHLALREVHHQVVGQSAFNFDNPYVNDELTVWFDARVDDRHSLGGSARFDLDQGHLEDYSVWAKRREHCLIWGISYNVAYRAIEITLELTGLSPHSRPIKSRPLVTPAEVPPLPEPIPGPNPLVPGGGLPAP
jgi:lipopolysaccharide export system protein LptA